MNQTIYEIYVDNVFEEVFEEKITAVARALNIEDELGQGRVKILENTYTEVTDWKV